MPIAIKFPVCSDPRTLVPTAGKSIMSQASEPKPLQYDHWDSPSDGPPNAQPQSLPRRKPVPPPLESTRHSHLSALKNKYSQTSRRTKIIVSATIICLLILTIGLAAGLSCLSNNKTQNLPLPTTNGGPYRGDLTYYAPGLGACGIDSKNGDSIVSVSHLLFDGVSKSSNPNQNPLCGKMIRARRGTGSVDLRVVDRCTGCKARDLDVTEKTFERLASVERGRVDVQWSWLEGVPGGAA